MERTKPAPVRESAVPRYEQLRNTLISMIRDGQYLPGMKLPTEPEIAEQYGVSRMTANRAILSLVSDGLLYRKKKAGTFVSEEVPEIRLPVLRPVVVVNQPDATMLDHYFQGLFWNLNSEAAAHGITLKTTSIPETDRVASLMASEPNPLIVLSSPRHILDDLLEIARMGTQVIVVGASWQGYGIHSIDSDNLLGSAMAVEHLLSLGHREIAFVGAWPDDSNTADRVRGFRAAMLARNLDYREDRVLVATGTLHGEPASRERVATLLTSDDRPTAVFAAGGQLAMEVIGVAQSMGLRVPEDLSIVGYDDIPAMLGTYPAVTTIRQPLAAMARAAAQAMLDERMAGVNPTVFDPELVIRGTTAVPSKPIARPRQSERVL